MKAPKLFLLLGLLVLLSGAPPVDPLDQSLIAYYSFNACDARDDSGNGSDGKLFGSVECWCGVDDDGLLLDGVQDYLEFPGPVNRYFTTSDFTISFYFKPDRYTVFKQSLLSKRPACDEYHMFDLQLDMNDAEVDTRLHESPDKFFARLSPTLSTPAGWHHFALVREGLRATTYINGQRREESFRCSGLDLSNDAVLSFSNSPCIATGAARRFRGIIDEVRVYDRALTPQDIGRLYRQFPIENAQMDCFTFVPEIHSPLLPGPGESQYLYAAYSRSEGSGE